MIYDVVEMLEVAALHQQIDIENGHPATPTHILRFAAMPPFPAWFAIRRRPFDGVWKVVSVTSDNTHEELWTERFWPESCQETMDQWMRRLLRQMDLRSRWVVHIRPTVARATCAVYRNNKRGERGQATLTE
ncbi:MAG: hypothetical protein HS117_17460 [Verrucomicrobiaceae bacterium]|nr:hypothetical protein [Verrucomicrobiaceae bacterium]